MAQAGGAGKRRRRKPADGDSFWDGATFEGGKDSRLNHTGEKSVMANSGKGNSR